MPLTFVLNENSAAITTEEKRSVGTSLVTLAQEYRTFYLQNPGYNVSEIAELVAA